MTTCYCLVVPIDHLDCLRCKYILGVGQFPKNIRSRNSPVDIFRRSFAVHITNDPVKLRCWWSLVCCVEFFSRGGKTFGLTDDSTYLTVLEALLILFLFWCCWQNEIVIITNWRFYTVYGYVCHTTGSILFGRQVCWEPYLQWSLVKQ